METPLETIEPRYHPPDPSGVQALIQDDCARPVRNRTRRKSHRATPMPDAYVAPRGAMRRRPSMSIEPVSEDDPSPSDLRPQGLHDARLAHLRPDQQASVICHVVATLADRKDWLAMGAYLASAGVYLAEQMPADVQLGQMRRRLAAVMAACEHRVLQQTGADAPAAAVPTPPKARALPRQIWRRLAARVRQFASGGGRV